VYFPLGHNRTRGTLTTIAPPKPEGVTQTKKGQCTLSWMDCEARQKCTQALQGHPVLACPHAHKKRAPMACTTHLHYSISDIHALGAHQLSKSEGLRMACEYGQTIAEGAPFGIAQERDLPAGSKTAPFAETCIQRDQCTFIEPARILRGTRLCGHCSRAPVHWGGHNTANAVQDSRGTPGPPVPQNGLAASMFLAVQELQSQDHGWQNQLKCHPCCSQQTEGRRMTAPVAELRPLLPFVAPVQRTMHRQLSQWNSTPRSKWTVCRMCWNCVDSLMHRRNPAAP
jgi:hypothetical protein